MGNVPQCTCRPIPFLFYLTFVLSVALCQLCSVSCVFTIKIGLEIIKATVL